MPEKSITLSEPQKEVLSKKSGRHLVLAPPGAGKTELLVQRLKKALDGGTKAKEIACLTFTNRAARSMQERVGEIPREAHIGNFHAYAIDFLKEVGEFKSQYTVLDEEDSYLLLDLSFQRIFSVHSSVCEGNSDDPILDLLESHNATPLHKYFGMKSMGGPSEKRPASWSGRGELRERLAKLIHPFINFKTSQNYNLPKSISLSSLNQLRTALGFSENQSAEARPLIWSQAILLNSLDLLSEAYSDLKKHTRALDFDDLLLDTLNWLVHHKDSEYFQSYKWVQVDEAQDLNDLQWEILNNIVHPDGCLMIFADPQQAIFSFMGSKLETLESFTQDMNIMTLDINYRSPKYLVDLFRDYAEKNMADKADWKSSKNTPKEPADLVYCISATDIDELANMVNKIQPKLYGISDGSIAILAKSNKKAIECSEALYYSGIDHFIVAQFDIFRLRIIKDFMAFLQVISIPETRFAWIRIFYASRENVTISEALIIVNECYSSGILPHWLIQNPLDQFFYPPAKMVEIAHSERIVVLDTETTGVDPSNDEIIQFAAVEIVKGSVGRSLNVFIKTDLDVGSSEETHHISNTYLNEHGLERKSAFLKIIEFVGDSPIAAHNMYFDLTMLEANIQKELGVSFRKGRDVFCTLEVARALDPDSIKHTLEFLIERYDLKGSNTHDALDDVLATVELLLYFKDMAASKEADASAFVARHTQFLKSVDYYIGEKWRELRAKSYQQFGFDNLFETFMLLSQKNPYNKKHIEDVHFKLLRHMKLFANDDCMKVMLERELPKYLLYREPDLILETDRVVVSTIHRAKGLEFESVIIPSCHSNSFPSYFATQEKSGEKEREDGRVLYVAITRAKRRVIILQPEIYTTARGKGMNVGPSPFLTPLLNHFTRQGFPKVFNHDVNDMNKSTRRCSCPECGRTWPWDGSIQRDNRCFGCGHVPD